jgi:histidinol-phosphate aminotransferase
MLTPRSAIQNLALYRSPISSREGLSLDLNENLAGCSPRVLERLRSLTARDISHYPQREDGERLVAGHLGVPAEQVLLTNGADEGIALLFSTYLGTGDELLFADPTFVMYPIVGGALGATLVRVQSGDDLALPVAEILRRVSERTRVVVIANPNNPTGTVASRGDLLEIVKSVPRAAILIDEAYCEFSRETMMAELARYPNLFAVRTFSKVYGLAGLRLGVLVGPAEQIGFIRRGCAPFNVNAVALACLETALADQEFVRDYVEQMREGCRRIESLCAELGLRCWPSSTNFVLVRIGPAIQAFVAAMQRRGVVVRDSSGNPGCKGCVRITAATRGQMDQVVDSFRQAWDESRSESGKGSPRH